MRVCLLAAGALVLAVAGCAANSPTGHIPSFSGSPAGRAGQVVISAPQGPALTRSAESIHGRPVAAPAEPTVVQRSYPVPPRESRPHGSAMQATPISTPTTTTQPQAAQTTTSDAAADADEEIARELYTVGRQMEARHFHQAAVMLYEKAHRHDPSRPGLSRRLARLYRRLDQPMKAKRAYMMAVLAQPRDADLLTEYGSFAATLGDFDASIAALKKALRVNENHRGAYIALAVTLTKQGRTTESLKLFEHVVGRAAAHSNVGVILAKEGRHEEAKSHLAKAIELQPGLEPAATHLAKLGGNAGPQLAEQPPESETEQE